MVATCINKDTYNDTQKVDKTFADVLTVNEIKRRYIGKYSTSKVQEVLFYLEENNKTISDVHTQYGKERVLFYYDNTVEQELLAELKRRGIKQNTRVRYKVPTYLKFYSVFQYDRIKFRKLLNEWLKTPAGQNRTYKTLAEKQKDILEQCWILDEYNQRKRDCDTPHIFRYRTLQKILECIAQTLMNDYCIQDIDSMKYLLSRTGIRIYLLEDYKPQAELLDTIMEDIKYRIDIHLQLLRGLKKGLDVENAVRRAYMNTCPITKLS